MSIQHQNQVIFMPSDLANTSNKVGWFKGSLSTILGSAIAGVIGADNRLPKLFDHPLWMYVED